MPLFEYKCGKCNHVTTFLEKAGTTAVHRCQECDSKDMTKMFSTFAAQSGNDTQLPSAGCGGCQNDCQFAGG